MPSKLAISALLATALSAGTVVQSAAAAPPPGYVLVDSGTLPSAAGGVRRTVLECPPGLVPFGGGVTTPLFGPENVNSSLPTPTGWSAAVSNPGGASTFEVTFTCGLRPKRYSIARSAAVLVPPGAQTSVAAVCPTRSDPLGGGGFSDAGVASVSMNSTYPVPGEWVVNQGNASAGDTHVTAFAVCGHVRGSRLVSRPVSVLSPGLTLGGVTCPGTKVPLGGGAFTSSTSLAVKLYSTFPTNDSWDVDLRNETGDGATVLWQPFAVCAGTR